MENNYTVLVIDDETIVRSMVCGILEDAGFSIIEAESGHEGIQKAKQYKP
ncbi:MAG: response regulator, partial [Gammaproteobacteria bacterium]